MTAEIDRISNHVAVFVLKRKWRRIGHISYADFTGLSDTLQRVRLGFSGCGVFGSRGSAKTAVKVLSGETAEWPWVGEIVISGWVVMKEYYKDPEETAAVKRPDGLYTGDLGRFDNEGYLYIVGRKKEMIKVAGQIVYAPEVEAAFYKNEDVAEVAVIGVPDEMRGETLRAYVVLNEGVSTTPEDLRYFAKEHLAQFKVPQSIEIRTELPKNRTGKIDKASLKEQVLT